MEKFLISKVAGISKVANNLRAIWEIALAFKKIQFPASIRIAEENRVIQIEQYNTYSYVPREWTK